MIPVPVHRRCIMMMESVDRRVQQQHPPRVLLLTPPRVLHRVPLPVQPPALHQAQHRVLLK